MSRAPPDPPGAVHLTPRFSPGGRSGHGRSRRRTDPPRPRPVAERRRGTVAATRAPLGSSACRRGGGGVLPRLLFLEAGARPPERDAVMLRGGQAQRGSRHSAPERLPGRRARLAGRVRGASVDLHRRMYRRVHRGRPRPPGRRGAPKDRLHRAWCGPGSTRPRPRSSSRRAPSCARCWQSWAEAPRGSASSRRGGSPGEPRRGPRVAHRPGPQRHRPGAASRPGVSVG